MPLINIHTHKKCIENDTISIRSYNINQIIEDYNLVSVGIHPWYIKIDKLDLDIDLINNLAMKGKIKAIGEIGLDKFSESSIKIQERVFIEQIKISEYYQLPVIIHSVKRHNDIIRIYKKLKPKQKWIIHGFTGGLIMCENLINCGFYISFGNDIINHSEKLYHCLKHISTEKIFLETDENDVSIKKLYKKVSEIKNIPLKTLEETIFANYKKCFRK